MSGKNSTKLYFGADSRKYLNEELPKYGTQVVPIYDGSYKRLTREDVILVFRESL